VRRSIYAVSFTTICYNVKEEFSFDLPVLMRVSFAFLRVCGTWCKDQGLTEGFRRAPPFTIAPPSEKKKNKKKK